VVHRRREAEEDQAHDEERIEHGAEPREAALLEALDPQPSEVARVPDGAGEQRQGQHDRRDRPEREAPQLQRQHDRCDEIAEVVGEIVEGRAELRRRRQPLGDGTVDSVRDSAQGDQRGGQPRLPLHGRDERAAAQNHT